MDMNNLPAKPRVRMMNMAGAVKQPAFKSQGRLLS
jgi:hypothetical protein